MIKNQNNFLKNNIDLIIHCEKLINKIWKRSINENGDFWTMIYIGDLKRDIDLIIRNVYKK
jgi:hypothetical protein